MYQESLNDKAKSAEELSQLTYKSTLDTKKIVDSLQTNFDQQAEDIEIIRNDMKQIVKNDNINSKQITELEQSEGIKLVCSILMSNWLPTYTFLFYLFTKGMNMELNNKEDIDPLLVSTTDIKTKVQDIYNNIDKKLRPILSQLNEDGEPTLTLAQDRSKYHRNIVNRVI